MACSHRLAVPAALALAGLALAAPPPALESLVQAERRFSATSVERGMKEAFLAFLADDGIIFRPLPVNGKRSWASRSPVSATLIWEPAFAEVSAAGDLGWTTGPWEFRPPAGAADRPVFHGDFMSVWRRDPGGEWKVAVDLGCSHAPPARGGLGSVKFEPGPAHAGTWSPRAALAGLEAAEQAFAELSATRDHRAGIAAWGDKNLRCCRDGEAPRLGLAAARRDPADSSAYHFRPDTIRVAASGDLGYAYGVGERLGPGGTVADSSVFLRIWRRGRQGDWKLALAVVNPIGGR